MRFRWRVYNRLVWANTGNVPLLPADEVCCLSLGLVILMNHVDLSNTSPACRDGQAFLHDRRGSLLIIPCEGIVMHEEEATILRRLDQEWAAAAAQGTDLERIVSFW